MASEALTFFVGVDEAGYGPNIGPLAMCAAGFVGPADVEDRDWWRRLKPRITRSAADDKSDGWIIDDSKRVLARSDGHQRLSKTIHAVLDHLGVTSRRLGPLFELLDLAGDGDLQEEHWFDPDHAHECESIESVGLAEAFAKARLAVARIKTSLVFASRFNTGLGDLGNKAEVERVGVCRLLTEALANAPADAERVSITVDRLGGRRYSRTLVEDVADGAFVMTVCETQKKSIYRFDFNGREVEIRFEVEADSRSLPVALASMVAKYLRERCMTQINRFWESRVPGLRPTAGYPGDARRFFDEIQPTFASLGLEPRLIWRER